MTKRVSSEVRPPPHEIVPIPKPLPAHHNSGRPGSRSQGEHTIDLSSLSIKPNAGNASINRRSNADAATVDIPSSRLLSGIFGRKHRIRSSYFSLYRPLKTKRERGILALGIILALAAGVPLPIVGVIFGRLINSFPPDNDQIRKLVGELLGVAVAYFCITWGWSTCWGVVGERVSRGLREDLLRKAVGMDIAWFEVEAPDIAHRLTADTQTIQLGTSEKVGLFLQSIAYFIAAFTTGFILNARLTGIMFAGVVPTMFLVVTVGSKFTSKYAAQATEHSGKATAVAEGAINAVQVVQAFDALDRLAEEHMGYMKPAVRNGIKKALAAAGMLGLVYFVAYSANALAFWEGSQQIAHGLFSDDEGAGTVYTVVFLILDASFVVGQFGPFLQVFALAAAAGQKIIELLDKPQPVINVYSTDGLGMPQPVEENDLSLRDVTFVYPARSAVRVVEHLNLTFPAGKVTAIVGSSGSGKSTIAAMLLRFYDPSSGRVQIGQHDLRDLNVREYRKHVALVDQQAVLFSGTVMDNIKHGLLHVEGLNGEEADARCRQAAVDANAWDFIMALPNGFDTKLGGGGATELSGGQRQRISLARALVADPSILVLDEPTSALDSVSESIVLEALEKAKSRKGRTTIMIAHRLATVQRADKIVVMGSGHVLEEGSHEELLERKGAYHDLVKAQKLVTGASSASSISSATTRVEDNSHLIHNIVDEKFKDDEADSVEESPAAKTEYSVATLLRRCISLSKPDVAILALGLSASLVSGGLIIGESIIFGNLISILNNKQDTSELTRRANFFSLIFFILSLIALVAYIVSGSAFGIVSERLIRRIRDISLRTILRQDLEWFQQPGRSSSALVSMLNMDAGHLAGLSGVILGTICSVTTSIVGGIILAHIIAWKIAIVLLAAVPVMIGSGFLRLRILAKMEQRHETAYLEAAALATEACSAMRTVAALGREQDVSKLYSQAIEKPYRESLRFITFGNFWLAFALSITYFVYALGYWWGSRQVANGDYDTRQFFIVLPALLFSAQASGQMFSLAPEVTRARAAAQSIFDLHDQKPTIDLDPLRPRPGSGSREKPSGSADISLVTSNLPVTKGKGKIEFRGIHFSYAGRSAAVLQGINLIIKPGTFVAFVGASGAGKTTALSLIERFHDPTSGSVLIDDADIRKLSVRQHRGRISLVAQEPCLFPGSISFNISLGASPGVSVTEEDITRVCKMVGLHEFILSLPQAYATDVGANGSLLSGGQKQRIALARALVRDPEILLLDEATSALDSVSEQLVQQSIAAASKGRTCVAIAHRLASVQKADWIYVFESGRVVEAGRHEELAAAGGRYAQMVTQQTLA